MEIEEFQSHIIENIKNACETWNSPLRLSLDSLHLDEIEEINLNNMQEDADKKVLQCGSYLQNNDDVNNDGSNHDTSSDGSGH
ncbi:hypothetical protein Gotur_021340 [Gossypium turneri]